MGVLFAPERADVGRICATAAVVLAFGLLCLGALALFVSRPPEGLARTIDLLLAFGGLVLGLYAAFWSIGAIWGAPGFDERFAVLFTTALAAGPLAGGVVIRLIGRRTVTGARGRTLGLIGGAAAITTAVFTIVAPIGTGVVGLAAFVIEVGVLLALPIMLAHYRSGRWQSALGERVAAAEGLAGLPFRITLGAVTVLRLILRLFTAGLLTLAVLFALIIIAPFVVVFAWDVIAEALGRVPDPAWEVSGQICLTALAGFVFGLGIAGGSHLATTGAPAALHVDRALGALLVAVGALGMVLVAGTIWGAWSWPNPFDDEQGARLWELAWGLVDIWPALLVAAMARLWSRARAQPVMVAGAVASVAAIGLGAVAYAAAALGESDPWGGEGILARVLVSLLVVSASALVTAGLLAARASLLDKMSQSHDDP